MRWRRVRGFSDGPQDAPIRIAPDCVPLLSAGDRVVDDEAPGAGGCHPHAKTPRDRLPLQYSA